MPNSIFINMRLATAFCLLINIVGREAANLHWKYPSFLIVKWVVCTIQKWWGFPYDVFYVSKLLIVQYGWLTEMLMRAAKNKSGGLVAFPNFHLLLMAFQLKESSIVNWSNQLVLNLEKSFAQKWPLIFVVCRSTNSL